MTLENNDLGPNLENIIKERFGEDLDFENLDEEVLSYTFLNTTGEVNYFYSISKNGEINKLEIPVPIIPYSYVESLPEGSNVKGLKMSSIVENASDAAYIVHEQVHLDDLGSNEKQEGDRLANVYKIN